MTTLTKKELLKLLEPFDDDAEVRILDRGSDGADIIGVVQTQNGPAVKLQSMFSLRYDDWFEGDREWDEGRIDPTNYGSPGPEDEG